MKTKNALCGQAFLVCYHSEQLIEMFSIGKSALPFSWSSYNLLNFGLWRRQWKFYLSSARANLTKLHGGASWLSSWSVAYRLCYFSHYTKQTTQLASSRNVEKIRILILCCFKEKYFKRSSSLICHEHTIMT